MKKTLGDFKKLIAIFLLLGMLISQFGVAINFAHGASGDFLITGTGIKEEVSISKADWSKYSIQEKIYSTNNSLGFHKIVKVKGYDLWDLIGKDNLKKDKNYSIKFISSPITILTTSFAHLDMFISSISLCPKVNFGKSLSKSSSPIDLSSHLTGGLNLFCGKSPNTFVYLAIIGLVSFLEASVKSL